MASWKFFVYNIYIYIYISSIRRLWSHNEHNIVKYGYGDLLDE